MQLEAGCCVFDMRPVEQGAAGDECDGATDERPSQVQYEAIEVVVYRLRKKLAGTGLTLMTLRGLGYLLRADA